MLQVSERGSPNFKRELQRRTNPIRAALHFRGDAHPTLGDTPNRMVRETAEQVTPLPQLHRDWATPILRLHHDCACRCDWRCAALPRLPRPALLAS
jgi:hypothetical protein